MAQRISSTPCDASCCEATEAAPLLDVEKGVPEERATSSLADDGGVETSGCRRFFQGFLAVVWLYMVNQMRKDYSASYGSDRLYCRQRVSLGQHTACVSSGIIYLRVSLICLVAHFYLIKYLFVDE
ncbi:uncharacterized protein [Triticum aestivum]|uniref:uncharacterized protein n=1 Tax=Triticum aestivum TaxID=4565 RepID=UPI001D02D824|nr:uncharacterized protein LOC123094500 [Triticum aestivum]